jgi:hypothetical protein
MKYICNSVSQACRTCSGKEPHVHDEGDASLEGSYCSTAKRMVKCILVEEQDKDNQI